jgi:hypothetical protein
MKTATTIEEDKVWSTNCVNLYRPAEAPRVGKVGMHQPKTMASSPRNQIFWRMIFWFIAITEMRLSLRADYRAWDFLGVAVEKL